VTDNDSLTVARTAPPQPQNRPKPLILVVDDEPCISLVVQLKLVNAGYDVVRASSGSEGLEKFVALHPDILIADVKMPGMSGIELCNRCEQYREDWQFLIIVLTSQLDPETLRWLTHASNCKYLPKPFSPRAVLKTVQEYIESRAAAAPGQQKGTIE
jgi:CheY-like chemotaxis protein